MGQNEILYFSYKPLNVGKNTLYVKREEEGWAEPPTFTASDSTQDKGAVQLTSKSPYAHIGAVSHLAKWTHEA